jgi:hypothetical protein
MTPQRPPPGALLGHEDARPRPSPQTDPTNPYHQESVGEWVAAELATERKQDEPGLTDQDREEREP